MKIVVLDGYTLNPGDLSWDGLKSLGDCSVYDRTPMKKTVERAVEAEIILTNKTVINREIISSLPKLKYIGILATGYDAVDIDAARERGICVTNVAGYCTETVAQMVFAHILNLTHRVGEHSAAVRQGQWSRSEDFCFWNYPLVELHGLKLGLVGFGRIGRAVTRIALAFGMKVSAYDVQDVVEDVEGVEAVGLDEVFSSSDIVSLHCPLTKDTKHLVNARRIAKMKRTAFLINTSRGPLIDEGALADALNTGVIAGAGLDVLPKEPPDAGNPLFGARNCYVTPHIAWATHEARKRLMEVAVENIRVFLSCKDNQCKSQGAKEKRPPCGRSSLTCG